MLEAFVKYICFIMMTLTGALVIKKILNENKKILNYKSAILALVLLIFPTLLHNTDYSSLNTIIILFINIIIYKKMFNKNIMETIILSSCVMIISFIADILTFFSISLFIPVEEMRTLWYMMIISNIVSCIYSVLLINIKIISTALKKVTSKISNNEYIKSVMFILLIFIVFCILAKNLYSSIIINNELISSFMLVSIFLILFIIYIKETNNYNNLSKQYDTMFNYINEFEELIEKEQFNRHEYKNQLAVLHCLSTEKKVKEKINEMLEDNINLEGKFVHELKVLPKGGIKGLMYYKSAIAKKNKIDLTINVSIELRSMLNKLSDEDTKTICKLIGVYYDNAIEAAAETKKKIVLVEIYELKDKVSFVFSNTFKKHKNFNERNKKGVSSKGDGHGYGLYFANKLLEKNKWLESKQEIIDKYYIQQLIIHKK